MPKDSVRGQWLEARDGLLKMLQEIPLSDEERAAIDGNVQALDHLLERLKDVPTPSACDAKHRTQNVIPVSAVLVTRQHVAPLGDSSCDVQQGITRGGKSQCIQFQNPWSINNVWSLHR